ncbi:hypothetical protein ACOSQ3_009730 [Xanthoceras sorbifolium]
MNTSYYYSLLFLLLASSFKYQQVCGPFRADSTTRPCTKVRGYDYSFIWGLAIKGMHNVPKGTSGVTIVPIHGAAEGATTLQQRIYDGHNLLQMQLDGHRSLRENVIHDVGAVKVIVFIDSESLWQMIKCQETCFKCIVLAPVNSSNYMKSKSRDIKLLKKNKIDGRWRLYQ